MKKLLPLLSLIYLSACNTSNKKEIAVLKQKIDSLEMLMKKDDSKILSSNLTEKLADNYNRYAELLPNDKKAPDYLFKAGQIYMSLKKSKKAINTFEKIYNNYTDYEKRPAALFLQAFIYDDQLKNIPKAREYYNKFINTFPNDELADDAKASLKLLGKTNEEIIKMFEQKRNKDTLKPALGKN